MEAVYEIDGAFARASPAAAGPWNATLQHGSAPAALIAWAAEQLPTASAMRVARLTIDLVRPVPIAPLEITTMIVREGRKIQLSAVSLLASGVEVVRAQVLKVRAAQFPLPETAIGEGLDLPPPEAGSRSDPTIRANSPFVTGVSMRVARGALGRPGPAAVWYRADRQIIAGQETSPLMRAAITADFCNGTSSVLDIDSWTFINADLTLSLARMPVGEWLLLDARTWLGPDGMGIAFARLADREGYFGRAVQSLLIEPR